MSNLVLLANTAVNIRSDYKKQGHLLNSSPHQEWQGKYTKRFIQLGIGTNSQEKVNQVGQVIVQQGSILPCNTHQHPSFSFFFIIPHFTSINKVSKTSKILAEFSSSSSLIHCSNTLTMLGIMALNIFYHRACQKLAHTPSQHTHTYNSRLIFAINKFREFAEHQYSSDSDRFAFGIHNQFVKELEQGDSVVHEQVGNSFKQGIQTIDTNFAVGCVCAGTWFM